MMTRVDGRELSFEVFGQGTPIVLIPPPAVGSLVFSHQVKELSARHQLILMELAGHGRSHSTGGRLTYANIADDICAILDHLNLHQAVVGGYSMGASVVLEFARRHGDRTMAGVLISGLSEASDVRLRTELKAAVQCSRLRAMRPLGIALSGANADSIASFRAMMNVATKADPEDVQSMFQCALDWRCTEDLPHLTMPMRLLVGTRDGRIRRYAKILEQGLPQCRSLWIDGAPHQLPLKYADVLNRDIVAFVAGLK